MASIAHPQNRFRFSWSGLVIAVAVALFLALVAYLLASDMPDVARKPASKTWAYAMHILGGSLVLATGPFQFIAPIRNRFRRYHRIAGYAFLGGSALAFIGYVGVQPVRPDLFFASQSVAIGLWMICAFVAWRAARNKHFLTHRHNMTRAFVLAAYFVGVRLMDKFGMPAMTFLTSSEDAQFAHSDWIAWVIPLVLVEAYYGRQWDRLLKKRTRVRT